MLDQLSYFSFQPVFHDWCNKGLGMCCFSARLSWAQVPVPLSRTGCSLPSTSSKGGEREILYLTTHSTHFIYGYMASDIWLRTILIVRKETRCRPIGYFYMHHPTDRITHTTAFVTPVVEHWVEREIAQWVHPMKDRSDDPSHHERTLYPLKEPW